LDNICAKEIKADPTLDDTEESGDSIPLKGALVKLPKKEDARNLDSWRNIMLLSIPSNVLSKMILN
jgi:hypothetical protein